MIKHLKWFSSYWKKTYWRLLFVVLLTIITIAAKVCFPLFLKLIIDELSGNYQEDKVINLILLFLVFSFINELLREGLPLIRGYMNNVYALMVRNTYYKKLTKKTSSFFIKFKTGDLITRLTDDIDGSWVRIFWYACSGILRPLEAILILGFTLGVMFYYSVPLTLCTFIPLPILLYVLHKLDESILKYTQERQEAVSKCNNILEASFSGVRVIKSTLSEKFQYEQYAKMIDYRIDKEKKFLYINQLVKLFAMMVNHAGTVIVIFIGSFLVVKGQVTIGTLLMFMLYLQNLIDPIWTLSFFYASSKQVFKYVDRLIEIDDSKYDIQEMEQGKKIEDFKSLKFKDIYYKYNDQKEDIFRNFSFDILKGEKIAILGDVGSGKTTLLEMISGNISPEKGKILFNNDPLDNIQKKSLRRMVGYVRQENILFSETIRGNILLGDDFVEDEIMKSLKVSMIDEEVNSFNNGIETMIGIRGIGLSGGQKQRIALARTIIRKPKLILMDDCTASMDAKTEQDFWHMFNTYYPDVSAIIVTHREQTARTADRIFVIADGGISEMNKKDLKNYWPMNSLEKENSLIDAE